MPYSGPASSYGTIGKAEAAYFAMINEQGGINGRKINFISRDDGYSPPKTVEMVRQLVEQEEVLAVVPDPWHAAQLSRSGTILTTTRCRNCSSPPAPSKWNDPNTFLGPWGGSRATRSRRASTLAISSRTYPMAKIAVLYQNDDLGKDYLAGLREGLVTRQIS